MTHAEKEIRNNEIVQLRRNGQSMSQIAERYGITLSAVWCICKKNNVGGVLSDRKANPKEYRNQYTSGKFDRIQNVKHHIKACGDFEYAGNYTGMDGFVDVKCLKCGAIQKKSMVSIRHHKKITCDACRENNKKALEKERKERAREYAERKKNNLHIYFTKQFEFKSCSCCGKLFITTKSHGRYCSKECSAKIYNSISKDKRVKKMRSVIVDKNITIEQLYKRDNGTCYICGQPCDWNAYHLNANGAFIAESNYPSIDHVIPLSKGGKHEWSNVRLACRKCNWEKSDSTSSLSA